VEDSDKFGRPCDLAWNIWHRHRGDERPEIMCRERAAFCAGQLPLPAGDSVIDDGIAEWHESVGKCASQVGWVCLGERCGISSVGQPRQECVLYMWSQGFVCPYGLLHGHLGRSRTPRRAPVRRRRQEGWPAVQ
jgi:hypothetical protein